MADKQNTSDSKVTDTLTGTRNKKDTTTKPQTMEELMTLMGETIIIPKKGELKRGSSITSGNYLVFGLCRHFSGRQDQINSCFILSGNGSIAGQSQYSAA